MSDKNLIGPWVRRFLLEHIVEDRNLARNTQASYRDTLRLLIPFASEIGRKVPEQLVFEDLSSENIRLFLLHLEGTSSTAPERRDPLFTSSKWGDLYRQIDNLGEVR